MVEERFTQARAVYVFSESSVQDEVLKRLGKEYTFQNLNYGIIISINSNSGDSIERLPIGNLTNSQRYGMQVTLHRVDNLPRESDLEKIMENYSFARVFPS